MTDLDRTDTTSGAAVSMDLSIIFERFRGGRMRASLLTVARSIGSGEEEGTGLTGLLLGGVRRGSCSSAETEGSDSSASSGRRCLPLLELLLLLGLL
jgi:hypothetical protein